MTPTASPGTSTAVLVEYEALVAFVAQAFGAYGLPAARAGVAAEALCYGDLSGHSSHGVASLRRLHLALLEEGRADPGAEPQVVADRGAAVLLDARRALGLWAASEAMNLAAERAAACGIAMVSVRSGTHFGCAGHHALQAVRRGMGGILASNCGRQRIVPPPGGRLAMLGTNPLSIAAPAGEHPPFVLDMSTTSVPTSRVRAAARAGLEVPEGWLEDDDGNAVTDPGGFDRGDAHLLWLGGGVGAAGYKGFGLGLAVEVLAALVSGAGLGAAPEALAGDGRPCGRDDDIGFFVAAIAPDALRPGGDYHREAGSLFATVLACPPRHDGAPVRYPGWHEATRAEKHRRDGVPLTGAVYEDLGAVASRLALTLPPAVGAR